MRIVAALALSAALLTAACATPDGQYDPGATVALGAGLAALGGIAYLASQDNHGPRYYGGGPYRGRPPGGYYHGNAGRYRGW